MSVRVFTRGFIALLVTQFFGATNDNLLKQIIALQVVSGTWQGRLGDGGQGVVTVLFTVPFILCSGWGGELADRVSKTRLARWLKVLEIGIASLALAALLWGDLPLSLGVLFVLALHSVFFGPAKYGMIPEILPEPALSRANGAINMLTNIAILTGAAIGGILSQAYTAHPAFPGSILVAVALAGFGASRLLPAVPAADPSARFSTNPFAPYLSAFASMRQSPGLLAVTLGWGFFYFAAILVIQAILDFQSILHLDDRQTSLLNVPLVLGIGAGSLLAGRLSGDRIRPVLVPVGAAGLTAFLLLLGVVPLALPIAWIGLGLLGLFGGLYIVPLQALIQARAPAGHRGRTLGAANFTSFCFVAAGGGVYWLGRSQAVGATAPAILFACGILVAAATALLWRRMKAARIA
jgi:MFS family permease